MKIERFHCGTAFDCGEMYDADDGDYMLYEAHRAAISALEAKCAALAAENAVLKSCVDGWCDMPATDAFLAEVRAGAVDEACLKISNAIVNCYQDEQVGLDEAATICGEFAAQLRQEAAK